MFEDLFTYTSREVLSEKHSMYFGCSLLRRVGRFKKDELLEMILVSGDTLHIRPCLDGISWFKEKVPYFFDGEYDVN